ncbi:MAG: TlpA family protein disulfide reductase [Candidatus Omnitrophica bacterium]|nr:TlpA family protein disulfide reductase [Candidatus Omnitrophota bacterium]
MRRLWVFAMVFVFSATLVSCSRAGDVGPAGTEGHAESGADTETIPAPDFRLDDLDGNEVVLSSYEGKSPVLMMFWSTWCVYCRIETPKLMQLRETYAPAELEIFGVDIGEGAFKVSEYARKMKLNYTILLDETSDVADAYGVRGVPTFFLVDREGNLVAMDHGITDRMKNLIREAVAG